MKIVTKFEQETTQVMTRIPSCGIAVLSRIVMATIFWKSALTKIVFTSEQITHFSLWQVWNVISLKWTISETTYDLFENEYDLPIIPPTWAAHLTLTAEIILPIFLILGFLTRLSALCMLIMTLVIQIFVYPHLWILHGLWVISLLVIMTQGGGRLSLDRLFFR